MPLLERPEWHLAVALVIGLLIGSEREQRKGDDKAVHRRVAGVRTFTVVALLGGVLAQFDSFIPISVGLAVLGLMLTVAYAFGDRSDPGITTEVALVLTLALGAYAQHAPFLALGAGMTTSLVLALRAPLHHLVKDVINGDELLDALTFGVAAVVILPLVPNRTVDPWGALNPFVLWRFGVIIMAITGIGYVLTRWVGARYGLFVAGLAGGFVSSSATIGSMGARATEKPALLRPACAGAAASSVATFVQLGILVSSVNPALAKHVLPSIVTGGLAAAVAGIIEGFRAAHSPPHEIPRGHPFRWQTAVLFVVIVASVTLGTVVLQQNLGSVGVYIGAALGGFGDAHATAAGVASSTGSTGLSLAEAHAALLIGVSTNTVTKIVIAFVAGPRRFARRMAVGLLLILGATWGAWAIV